MRANGFKTYIVTGGGQEFVRVYSERIYGIPPEQIVDRAADQVRVPGRQTGIDARAENFLQRRLTGQGRRHQPVIGKRPYAAFGNSTGDQQMLEWTGAGDGARLMMLVFHDDPVREYAYGPADGLPDTKVGTFSDALMR